MKNPPNLVHLTLPKSQHRTSINNININHWHCLSDSFQVHLELHSPRPRVTFSRHTTNCTLPNRMLLCCPIFLLFYSTSYYIHSYMLLSTFPNFTQSTWNLQPARRGITIHRRIKKHTLRERLHVHCRRQPILIANQMFELQPSLCVNC